jgi:integrase
MAGHASIITRKGQHVVIWRDAEHGRKCSADCTRDDHQHSSTFATAEAAKAHRTQVDAKLAAGERVTESAETFGAAADHWINTHPGTAGTRKVYRSTLTVHMGEFAARKLTEVAGDRRTAESFIVRHPRGRVMRTLLLGTLDSAVADGRLAAHRLAGIRMPRKVQGRREIIPATHAQLSIIADGLGPLGLTVWLMRGCGLRIAEALAIESGDFRDGYSTLRVQRQLRDGQTTPLKARGAGEYRDVPVPTWLAALVRRYVLANGRGSLFTVSYSAYIVMWRRHVRSAGLPVAFTPHQCRHAYASALLSQLVPITDVARWLGHRDISITYATYSHLLPDAAASARKALDTEWETFRAA